MKGALLFIAIFALSMLVIPMIALNSRPPPPPDQPPVAPLPPAQPYYSVSGDELLPPVGPPVSPVDISVGPGVQTADGDRLRGEPPLSSVPGVSYFRVLDERTGEIHTVPLRDYVRGVVAAEMPASFHPEALKAQAVAAHTFALHQHMVQQRIPDPALRGADFSADPQGRMGFVTEEVARLIFGYREDEHWQIVTDAVDAVLELILKHEGEPIVAAFHAISAGATEYASNVWTGSAPYLIPAPSQGDLLAPGFESVETFDAPMLRRLLLEHRPGIAFGEDPADWLEILERSSSGYVTTIRVGDATIRGIDLRRALYLRSHHFEIELDGQEFTFTVRGYGHGVGLSQRGAEHMARGGASFEEILANYYPGAGLYRVAVAGR
ncbi:MAG: SpoIID/LytB domain-containing protein [Oscillospiraceae bacterium]|nr:SpoIID/LytB domain-containing protein [Oscillospiraceae bacterium]